MTSTMTQTASDLNEDAENRYALVLEIAETAKRLLEESKEKGINDLFSPSSSNTSMDNVIYQALLVILSQKELGDNHLIG
jgi:hypothetical protein